MKEKDYVTYEVAILLKEKGYNEPCKYYFRNYDKKFMESNGLLYNKDYDNKEFDSNVVECTAPSLYEAHKWLREKHDLYIDAGITGDYAVDADGNKCDEWNFWTFDIYYITKFSGHLIDCHGVFDSYEEALNEGIKFNLNMEEKDYVTYEVAILLKEKDYCIPFNVDAYRYGNDGKRYWFSGIGVYETVDKVEDGYQRPNITYPCPTLYEAAKWLRNKHNLCVFVEGYYNSDTDNVFTATICNKITEYPFFEYRDSVDCFKTYEEALNEGIKKALNFI